MDVCSQFYIETDDGFGEPVKLGALPKPPGSPAVDLADFIPPLSALALPETVDYVTKARRSLAQVYGNDREGDCVVASGFHAIGLWTANDSDSGGEAVGTTSEALTEYHRIGGPWDRGLVITQALSDFTRNGLLVGGKRHKISGWAGVPQQREMIRSAIAIFGAVRIGMNLPGYWQRTAREGFVWKLSQADGSVGGHDVRLVGYTPLGALVSTWGKVGTIEWDALADRRIVTELYVEVSPDWTGPDGNAPSRYDAAGLAAALARVRSGELPEWRPDVEPIPRPWLVSPDPPAVS